MLREIGDRISKIRKVKSLTQEEFAKIAGVSRESIKKYEKGKIIPGGEFFYTLAQNMPELNLRWLLTNQGDMFVKNGNDSPKLEVRMEEVEEEIKRIWETIGPQKSDT